MCQPPMLPEVVGTCRWKPFRPNTFTADIWTIDQGNWHVLPLIVTSKGVWDRIFLGTSFTPSAEYPPGSFIFDA